MVFASSPRACQLLAVRGLDERVENRRRDREVFWYRGADHPRRVGSGLTDWPPQSPVRGPRYAQSIDRPFPVRKNPACRTKGAFLHCTFTSMSQSWCIVNLVVNSTCAHERRRLHLVWPALLPAVTLLALVPVVSASVALADGRVASSATRRTTRPPCRPRCVQRAW